MPHGLPACFPQTLKPPNSRLSFLAAFAEQNRPTTACATSSSSPCRPSSRWACGRLCTCGATSRRVSGCLRAPIGAASLRARAARLRSPGAELTLCVPTASVFCIYDARAYRVPHRLRLEPSRLGVDGYGVQAKGKPSLAALLLRTNLQLSENVGVLVTSSRRSRCRAERKSAGSYPAL